MPALSRMVSGRQDQQLLLPCTRLDEEQVEGKQKSRKIFLASLAILAVGACIVALKKRGGPQDSTSSDVHELMLVVPPTKDVADTRAPKHKKECSWGQANCNETQCCNAPGLQCYQQDQKYAQCRQSCTPQIPDPTHWNGKWWDCSELGPRAEGKLVECSKVGESCAETSCCADPGFQCFEKNDDWATCKLECAAGGPDLSDEDGSPWSCKALGGRNTAPADWLGTQCGSETSSCMETKCCQGAGQQCYMKDDYWAVCRDGCDPNVDQGWSCKEIGARTPSVPSAKGKFAKWVMETCSKPGEGCLESKCCLGMDTQCYQKNELWASCKRACTPGKDPEDNNEAWSCEGLGPRSQGNAVKGFPALYCFAVFQASSYEKEVIMAARENDGGVFACDEHSLLTADSTAEIWGEETVQFQGAPIIGSVDGTAGNTQLFVHAWSKIIEIGKWRDAAFTVKADPDTVFLPERLRWHLTSFVGQRVFVVNCAVWNMIYGSLEVFSFSAMEQWAEKGSTCNAPDNFGEDKYMTQCMDHLEVTRVNDWEIVGDKLCGTFTDCSAGSNAAFHPFKDKWSWNDCYKKASATVGR